MLEKLCPIFPTRDIAAAERFYAALGFQTVHRDEAEYLLVKREAAELHLFLSADHDPARSDHGAYLRPTDVDTLSEELSKLGLPRHGIPRFVPAENKPWGMRELALVDPDGNLIRAGQEIADG
jgi:catechol 2,3-dioxygenase-like lactoylglutathione lyase family enzyme